jgi:hypothetical protein
MIVVAVLALTIFHPGFCFPQLAGQQKQKALPELESSDGNDAVLVERKIQERQESE